MCIRYNHRSNNHQEHHEDCTHYEYLGLRDRRMYGRHNDQWIEERDRESEERWRQKREGIKERDGSKKEIERARRDGGRRERELKRERQIKMSHRGGRVRQEQRTGSLVSLSHLLQEAVYSHSRIYANTL